MTDQEYRLIRHKTTERTWYDVHMVFYDVGKPRACCVFPVSLEACSPKDLDGKLKAIGEAIRLPILNYEDF
jgi:hypothetical protein